MIDAKFALEKLIRCYLKKKKHSSVKRCIFVCTTTVWRSKQNQKKKMFAVSNDETRTKLGPKQTSISISK